MGVSGGGLGEQVLAAFQLLALAHLALKAAAPSHPLILSVSAPIPCEVGSTSLFYSLENGSSERDTLCPKSHCKAKVRPCIFVPATTVSHDLTYGAGSGFSSWPSTCPRRQRNAHSDHIIPGLVIGREEGREEGGWGEDGQRGTQERCS